jgi:hypothetical protein
VTMGLNSIGIESVMAFELPCGIRADGGYIASARTALVKWRSSLSDKFYQVYVDGRYAGATVDSQQRQMLVPLPASSESPVAIEVFAVEAEQADTDFSQQIDSPAGYSGRVKITMLRGQNLPTGATAQFYFDAGTGQIDYDNPLNVLPIRVWPAWQDKAGFGMSSFGRSDFGYDSSAAVGFGKGSFGRGEFGLDADTFEWLSPQLSAGLYKFAVKITDEAGNQSGAGETGPITVIPLPRPAEEISISSFDKQTNQLVLNISQ